MNGFFISCRFLRKTAGINRAGFNTRETAPQEVSGRNGSFRNFRH
jgi:hypothetical protein